MSNPSTPVSLSTANSADVSTAHSSVNGGSQYEHSISGVQKGGAVDHDTSDEETYDYAPAVHTPLDTHQHTALNVSNEGTTDGVINEDGSVNAARLPQTQKPGLYGRVRRRFSNTNVPSPTGRSTASASALYNNPSLPEADPTFFMAKTNYTQMTETCRRLHAQVESYSKHITGLFVSSHSIHSDLLLSYHSKINVLTIDPAVTSSVGIHAFTQIQQRRLEENALQPLEQVLEHSKQLFPMCDERERLRHEVVYYSSKLERITNEAVSKNIAVDRTPNSRYIRNQEKLSKSAEIYEKYNTTLLESLIKAYENSMTQFQMIAAIVLVVEKDIREKLQEVGVAWSTYERHINNESVMNSAPVTPTVVPSTAMPTVTFPAPPMEPHVANGNEDTSHEGRPLEPMAPAPPTKPSLMRTQTDLVSDQNTPPNSNTIVLTPQK